MTEKNVNHDYEPLSCGKAVNEGTGNIAIQSSGGPCTENCI